MHVHMYVCLPSSPCRFVCMYIDRRTDGRTYLLFCFICEGKIVKSDNTREHSNEIGGSWKKLYVLESDEVARRTDGRMDGWKRDQMTHQNNCWDFIAIHPHLPYIPRYSQVRAHVIHLMACSNNNNNINKRGTKILSFMRKGKWWNHEFGGQFAVISGRGTRVMKWWSTYTQGSAQNR